MTLRKFLNTFPRVAKDCFIDESAVVIGDVVLGEQASVWCNAVIRGDVNHIHIGKRTNIQDLSMLHVSHKRDAKPDGSPLIIGDDVTVGHQAMLHGCTIGDRVLIGMQSIVLDDAVIENDVIVGAGSLVPQHKRLENGYLYLGSPVKKIRLLTVEEREFLKYSADNYVKLAAVFLAEKQ